MLLTFLLVAQGTTVSAQGVDKEVLTPCSDPKLWSSWSESGDCSLDGKVSRKRNCNNPAPLYGAPCQGEEQQEVDCGILISGGGGGAETSVEVFSPSYQCILPSLPDKRSAHTSDGMTLCGGHPTSTTCTTFSSGKWVTSHALAEKRAFHTSWNKKEEGKIILMGGFFSGTTTETITEGEYDGLPGFNIIYHNTRSVCAIPDPTTNCVLLTGGYPALRTASRYCANGIPRDLPYLNQGRRYHGCGVYRDDSGDQVFLVTGGFDGSNTISSTETLGTGTWSSSYWKNVNNLPRKISGVRGVTLGGVLYMMGGYDTSDSSYRDEIYQWTGQDWEEVGKMKKARGGHAVSTIRLDEIKDFCT